MVTHRSAAYVATSLPRLLETCGEDDRVWLWHNGDDEATLAVLAKYRTDPRVARFHHSRENVRLHPPMQWLWTESRARFLAKVDDDCLVAPGWIETFALAHDANPEFGAIGCWLFQDEDYLPELSERKIVEFRGGHRVLRNLWVGGSGFLLKRSWVERIGPIGPAESFPQFCKRISRHGAINGWYVPFVRQEHMDDPRSPRTLIRSDDDLRARMPLTAQYTGARTVSDWTARLRDDARAVQAASPDWREYMRWWRRARRTVPRRIRKRLGLRAKW